MLQELQARAPSDRLTLNWLTASLHKHSFGLTMLVLALIAAVPGISIIGGVLLLIQASQMIAGCSAVTFPEWIGARSLPSHLLGAVVRRVIPALKVLEKVVYPRWVAPPQATKRVVGVIVMLLALRLLLTPIPFGNVMPAAVIALISLAYVEEDGMVLLIGLLIGLVVLVIDVNLVWDIVKGARRALLVTGAMACGSSPLRWSA